MQRLAREFTPARLEAACTRAMVKLVETSAAETRQNASASMELSSTTHEITRTAQDLAEVAENLASTVATFRT